MFLTHICTLNLTFYVSQLCRDHALALRASTVTPLSGECFLTDMFDFPIEMCTCNFNLK